MGHLVTHIDPKEKILYYGCVNCKISYWGQLKFVLFCALGGGVTIKWL